MKEFSVQHKGIVLLSKKYFPKGNVEKNSFKRICSNKDFEISKRAVKQISYNETPLFQK